MTINFHLIKNFISHFFTAKRKGHDVHSPFAYQLCEEVFYNSGGFYDFEKLKQLRKNLLRDQTKIKVEDFGAGSKTFNGNERKVADIAQHGISSSKQSEVLYKLINLLRPGTIIELGTSLGLNTLYLAKAAPHSKIYTIEGSSELVRFATRLSQEQEAQNIHFINGKFDEQVPELLNQVNTLDFLYVDGNHTCAATIRYFEMALEKKGNNSVFIFDDIYWSEEMTKAWNEIKKHPSVTLSIDAFCFGMIFFKEEIKEQVELRIFI